jgi:hypothetical protein
MEVIKDAVFLLLTPVMLLGFHYYPSLTARRRVLFVGFLAAVIAACGVRDAQMMRANVAQPPKWDFVLFWLYGRVAVQGLNFYEPGHALKLAEQHQLSVDPIGTWFLYPPQTMLLFTPLGWLDIGTAHLLWYVLLSGVLVLDIVLLWKTFLRGSGRPGLMLTAALVLTLKATSMILYFGQTLFIVLLMLLLFWRERERPRSGIWLAVGLFVKPVLALLPMVLVLQRNWRVTVSAAGAVLLISLLTVIAFGAETFWGFFTARPAANLPGDVYTDPINQSLLATVLRLTGEDLHGATPLFRVVLGALSLLLAGLTGWLVFRLGPDQADWALSLTLALALLVYPGALEHYSLLLIAPMLLLWGRRREFIGGPWGAAGFIALEYALIRGHYAFIANALIWFVLAGVGAWMIERRAGLSWPALFAR